ncbi:hydrogenase maturation protease [bacterium]|nr:hydrogenase maturation protease [bacterium]NIN92878.1 hydrogenase maturation protease [bacterium]NIO73921.1 hydrogenase maturation protease [bacterium]
MEKIVKVDKVVVLGVGNLLLRDEGVGVHLIQKLREMEIEERVRLVDVGTSILDFIPQAEDVSKLIIVDAIRLGGKPGKTYRICVDDSLLKETKGMTSLHQLGVVETLAIARKMGELPHTVIIGIEPKDMDYGLELSPEIERKMGKMVNLILEEVRAKRN